MRRSPCLPACIGAIVVSRAARIGGSGFDDTTSVMFGGIS